MTCVSLATGYPTEMSVSQSLMSCFRNLINVSLAVDFDIPEAKNFKEMLENPQIVAAQVPAMDVEITVEEKKDVKLAIVEEESESDDFDDIFG
ncbi:60S acidic ribosomal protein P0-like [Octopus sinensis]|uniref:60S acidic ribosomal protein P0-like n=1 Tax=Octopus sinensis TaxID=2607531 RepID=A0A6P7TVC8_9MOLL|nr:60S acidic ribosomal protein P0-like [Octopus sinensis]